MIQIDINMPANCAECMFTKRYYDQLYCNNPAGEILGGSIKDYTHQRHPECPLIEGKDTAYATNEINSTLKIYEIMLFENPDKELVYPSSKRSGFPDEGCIDHPGYFLNINDAIKALNNNSCDLRETVYNAAFILCRKPGLYEPVGKEDRKYFVWSEEKQGFFEAEEPEIFAHIAY